MVQRQGSLPAIGRTSSMSERAVAAPPDDFGRSSSVSSLAGKPPRHSGLPSLSFRDIAAKVLSGEVRLAEELNGTPRAAETRSHNTSPTNAARQYNSMPSGRNPMNWKQNRKFSSSEDNVLRKQTPERASSDSTFRPTSLQNLMPSRDLAFSDNGWVSRDPKPKPPPKPREDNENDDVRMKLRFGIGQREDEEKHKAAARAREKQVKAAHEVIQGCLDLKFLDEHQRWQVAEAMELLEVDPLQDVAVAHKKFFRVFVVKSGLLDASLYGESQRVIGPGEVIGDSMDVHNGVTSVADVRVRTRCQLLSIHATDFLRIIERTSIIFTHEKPADCEIDNLNPGRADEGYDRKRAINKVFRVPLVVGRMRAMANRTNAEARNNEVKTAMSQMQNFGYNSLEEEDDRDEEEMDKAKARYGVQHAAKMPFVSANTPRGQNPPQYGRRAVRSESPVNKRTASSPLGSPLPKAILRTRSQSNDADRKQLQWRSPQSGGIAEEQFIG